MPNEEQLNNSINKLLGEARRVGEELFKNTEYFSSLFGWLKTDAVLLFGDLKLPFIIDTLYVYVFSKDSLEAFLTERDLPVVTPGGSALIGYISALLNVMIRGEDYRLNLSKAMFHKRRGYLEAYNDVLRILNKYPEMCLVLGIDFSWLDELKTDRKLERATKPRPGKAKIVHHLLCNFLVPALEQEMGLRRSQTIDFIHGLLDAAKVPGYGKDAFEGEDYGPGEHEEKEQIRKWIERSTSLPSFKNKPTEPSPPSSS